ncbi:3-hydroxyacyl-CoA dehydrogenase family protein [Bacillus thuringiensis]|uniref:3-hydroxyacyl-CoA dehydrogenase family protein n=1 Tax=Bacillus tropicus TaxID=2026188 RepID=UPI0035D58475
MFNKIGVIGAGTMGVDVSTDLILHGIKVVLIDKDEATLTKASQQIEKNIRFAPLLNSKIPKLSKDQIHQSITLSVDLSALNEVQFIVENVNEDWNIKSNLYSILNQELTKDVFIGANTSCTSITKISGLTKNPSKVIGVHFMNPVYLKDTVEVIKGYHTSEECINMTKQFLAEIDKKPIIVNDYPGFVANRISHLYMNEAAFVVQDQVASPKNVDDIFKQCFGHKMGPLETADLIGIDTVVSSLNVLYESYQDPKYRCCPLLQKMVNAGYLGKKTGQGFYKY